MKVKIEDVISKYDRLGFDANQDMPGSLHWKALYQASSPDTKVILTVRDNEEQWFNSWYNFIKVEQLKKSFFDFSFTKIQAELSKRGYMGQIPKQQYEMRLRLDQHPFQEDSNDSIMPKYYSVSKMLQELKLKKTKLCRVYREHNEEVIQTVNRSNL